MRMTKSDYEIRRDSEQQRIVIERYQGVGDRDIQNLEFLLYGIVPGDMAYNLGCIGTLKKAIELMKKENGHG